MYSATFTFAKRHFDDEFHAIDQVIARVAKSISGYLGEESWENAATGYISNVYYWRRWRLCVNSWSTRPISRPRHLRLNGSRGTRS